MEVTPDVTLREVLRAGPGTVRIFMEFGMHCFGCAAASSETIAEAAEVHGCNLDELIDQLNDWFSEHDAFTEEDWARNGER